jgi:hypothetical protein
LHAKRQLVVGDGRFQLAYRPKTVEHALVQLRQQIEFALLLSRSRFARLEVRDGMLDLAEQRPLIRRLAESRCRTDRARPAESGRSPSTMKPG